VSEQIGSSPRHVTKLTFLFVAYSCNLLAVIVNINDYRNNAELVCQSVSSTGVIGWNDGVLCFYHSTAYLYYAPVHDRQTVLEASCACWQAIAARTDALCWCRRAVLRADYQ